MNRDERSTAWQLPWLRVALILRTMVNDRECGRDDVLPLLALRHRLAQRGWFN